MIVCLSDDPDIVAAAEDCSARRPNVFGVTYAYGTQGIPLLGPTENLYLVGHGIAGSGTSSVSLIGQQHGNDVMNGIQLWERYRRLMSRGYTGNVYIDACGAANVRHGSFSLIEQFRSQSDVYFPDTRVYGRKGDVDMAIPEPDDGSWVQAYW